MMASIFSISLYVGIIINKIQLKVLPLRIHKNFAKSLNSVFCYDFWQSFQNSEFIIHNS